jgi:hypothetical protein
VDKITFNHLTKPQGVKFYAYERGDGEWRFAMGDMPISNISITNSYAEGGDIKINDSLSSEDKELLMMASLCVLKEPNTSYFDDSRKQKLLDLTSKLSEKYSWGGFIMGGLLGGYGGYKYGLTQTKIKFNNLFKEEEKFIAELKKRNKKLKKQEKKEKKKENDSDYEDIFAEGGEIESSREDNLIIFGIIISSRS